MPKRICFECVGETFLKNEIATQGKRDKCSYCKETRKCYTIEDMTDRIEAAFEQHYVKTPTDPDGFEYAMMRDRESAYNWERDGEPVVYAIMNAADIPEQAAVDIQKLLEDKFADNPFDPSGFEAEFDGESYYDETPTDDRELREEWDRIEESLKTEARFFNQAAMDHIASLFGDLDKMQTHKGRPLIIDVGPGTKMQSVFRARAFQNDEDIKEALRSPDKSLGPPPPRYALSGRMNARGISVFYGANDPKVAIAEVRPAVGSKVIVAKFEIARPLKLLDLTALNDVRAFGSIFDPTTVRKLARAKFMRSLADRITRPVMPDHGDVGYLATQAIADFLATNDKIPVDGILFPSVQVNKDTLDKDALNIVLFHKASAVEVITLPRGTEIEVHFGSIGDEEEEPEFTIWEKTPDDRQEKKVKEKHAMVPYSFEDAPESTIRRDPREVTLRIVIDSTTVHVVKAVEFSTFAIDVKRFRSRARDHQKLLDDDDPF